MLLEHEDGSVVAYCEGCAHSFDCGDGDDKPEVLAIGEKGSSVHAFCKVCGPRFLGGLQELVKKTLDPIMAMMQKAGELDEQGVSPPP